MVAADSLDGLNTCLFRDDIDEKLCYNQNMLGKIGGVLQNLFC